MKNLGLWLAIAIVVGLTGCDDSNDVTNPPVGGGSADIDALSSTPASGDTNISGAGLTVETTAEDADTTRVRVNDPTAGDLREVLVYFTTLTGAVEHITYSWGTASLFENIVTCDAAACSGASVNTTTQEIELAGVPLDNTGESGPGSPPTKFSTLGQAVPASLIVYP